LSRPKDIDLDREEVEELVERLRAPLSPEDEVHFDYDDIAAALARKGPEGLDALVRQMNVGDERRVRAALFGISVSPAGAALHSDRILTFLNDSRSGVVTEAVYALGRAQLRLPHVEVRLLANHSSQHVRGAVLHYLARIGASDAYEVAVGALQDPEFIVREAAVDVLDELKRPEAIDPLSALLSDPERDVRQAVRTAIENLRSYKGDSKLT
jgi:HEAT repeat protein